MFGLGKQKCTNLNMKVQISFFIDQYVHFEIRFRTYLNLFLLQKLFLKVILIQIVYHVTFFLVLNIEVKNATSESKPEYTFLNLNSKS